MDLDQYVGERKRRWDLEQKGIYLLLSEELPRRQYIFFTWGAPVTFAAKLPKDR